MTRSSARACAAPDPMPNCCARASNWRGENWDLPRQASATISIPACSAHRSFRRRSYRWGFDCSNAPSVAPAPAPAEPSGTVRLALHDELKFTRALIERNFLDDGYFEAHIAEPFLLQNLPQARADALDRGAARLLIEGRIDADRKTERRGCRDLHLKSRYPLHEHLVDGVRADEVRSARGVPENRHLFHAPNQILNHDAARTRLAHHAQNVGHSIADQRHGVVVEIGDERVIFMDFEHEIIVHDRHGFAVGI